MSVDSESLLIESLDKQNQSVRRESLQWGHSNVFSFKKKKTPPVKDFEPNFIFRNLETFFSRQARNELKNLGAVKKINCFLQNALTFDPTT